MDIPSTSGTAGHKQLCRFKSMSIVWWFHDNLITWKRFPHYWPFLTRIHQSLQIFGVSFVVSLNNQLIIFKQRLSKQKRLPMYWVYARAVWCMWASYAIDAYCHIGLKHTDRYWLSMPNKWLKDALFKKQHPLELTDTVLVIVPSRALRWRHSDLVCSNDSWFLTSVEHMWFSCLIAKRPDYLSYSSVGEGIVHAAVFRHYEKNKYFLISCDHFAQSNASSHIS